MEQIDVVLYGRPGCHLCDDAATELSRLAPDLGLRITTVDIMTDTEAHDRWWADIPVVICGTTTLRAPFTVPELRRVLLHEVRRSV